MYLEIFQADFAVSRVFLGISRDFAEIPEFRGSATARNIRSPGGLCNFSQCIMQFKHVVQDTILIASDKTVSIMDKILA